MPVGHGQLPKIDLRPPGLLNPHAVVVVQEALDKIRFKLCLWIAPTTGGMSPPEVQVEMQRVPVIPHEFRGHAEVAVEGPRSALNMRSAQFAAARAAASLGSRNLPRDRRGWRP